MPPVKNVGEPCAGEPHARFDVGGGRKPGQSARPARPRRLPPTLPPPRRLRTPALPSGSRRELAVRRYARGSSGGGAPRTGIPQPALGGSGRVGGLRFRVTEERIDPDEIRGVKKKEVTARCRRRRVSCRTASPRGSEGPASVSPLFPCLLQRGSARRAFDPRGAACLCLLLSLIPRADARPASGRASEHWQRVPGPTTSRALGRARR
jgi:hypothetical protein